MEESNAARSRFGRICVYCGSSIGKRAAYQDAAIDLGNELVRRKVGLVYGGGSVGLMGLVSKAVHMAGGSVIGIIPWTLMSEEVGRAELYDGQVTGESVGEVRAVANMHERKAEMARLSDAFIALPGGYGTLEELLEVITWAQLGIHTKPVGLLNVEGYYNSLLDFVDRAVDEGFIKPIDRRIIVSASNAQDLLQKLEFAFVMIMFDLSFYVSKEYVPVQDALAAKLQWEIEMVECNSSHPTQKLHGTKRGRETGKGLRG
ncbi:hypothetical protein HPP92_008685 [Vanilla planifolia]|uniref:Cytokinin riboside 5'-monophosphate phosphoribohydrolase n=1 Tax=Vanilla planifolia TaxID=51239 RepID=A0A835R6U3_VANPL|nr:hypothetical protein HPP92_008685 [Vanilla planifolia]